IVDWILGIRAIEEGLLIDPCIPKEWESFKVKRLFRGTYYQITVSNPDHKSSGVKIIKVNGNEVESNLISPVKDKECFVEIIL
ncbi:MAG: glycosyl transferase, partial [Candidatus Marinimicrobia bacterium]|nr:glycosyl transferase [Candidatus Neomarinimicrobiota bacterium]